jgi:transcriptional regulator with XRE-family HTH domain|nr:MAG TPA: helix-turn-helix domain protein [Caudoviricetes sp.]
MFKKETIIKLLEERGWSNYKLCKESNLAPATLSDILNGKSTNPKTETLEKIAKALNVSMDDFFIEDNKNSIDEQQSSNPDDFDELDPEIRAIARDMKNMSSKNKELLKELIKTMSKVGDDELNK